MNSPPDTQNRTRRCLVIGLGDWRGELAYKQRTLMIAKAFEGLGWTPTVLWFSRLVHPAGSEVTLRRDRICLPMPPFCAGNLMVCKGTRRAAGVLIKLIAAIIGIDLIVA